MQSLIFTADDFGLSEAVNEGIERAHRDGVLTHASLMVAGAAAADAVRRARTMPGLHIGLHLVTVEGPAVLPRDRIPALVDTNGRFPGDQLLLGLRYFFLPHVRKQLAAEIRAQFASFAATGLTLSHADAHKHMHLHPTVGRLMLAIGRDYGLPRIRVPAEPPDVMAACGVPKTLGARAMHAWCGVLRAQARAAGVASNDAVFGLAWTGHFTEDRVLAVLRHLPPGDSEFYFHPAARREKILDALVPGYEHESELLALLSPRVRAALSAAATSSAASPRTATSRSACSRG